MEWNKAAALALPAKEMYRFSEPCSLSILYTNRETPLIQTSLPAASWLHTDCNVDYSTSYLTTCKDASNQLQPEDLIEAFTSALPLWFKRVFANKRIDADGHLKNLFSVLYQTEQEAVLELNHEHLDVKISLLLVQPRPNAVQKNIVLSTTVAFRNLWGRLYFMTVKSLYERVLSTTLKRTVIKMQA